MLSLSTLGLVHLVFGILALVSGTAVTLIRKGNRSHRALGYLYLYSMLGTNITALLIYDLTGTVNMFHIFALFSLLTLLAGMLPIFTRPKHSWLPKHAHFMAGSYLGVVLATAAEITVRVPGWDFGLAVTLTVLIGSIIGVYLMMTLTPKSIAKLNPRRYQKRNGLPVAGD